MKGLEKKPRKSLDEIVESLAGKEKAIVKRLRSLVLECLPKAEELNSYGVPFYRRHRMICFIWPPSIYWGPQKPTMEGTGVGFGFCQGNLMLNDEGLLLKEGRKQVYCMYFKSLSEIRDDQIRSLLFEAGMIDDNFGLKKRKKLKK